MTDVFGVRYVSALRAGSGQQLDALTTMRATSRTHWVVTRENMMRTKIGILFLLAISAPAAQASMFCVGNTAELLAALATAETEFNVSEIKLKTGTYFAPAPNGFLFRGSQGGSSWIGITGGWNSDCTARTQSVYATLLQGNALGPVLWFNIPMASPSRRVYLENFMIVGGETAANTSGGGLRYSGSYDGAFQELYLYNLLISGNHSNYFAGGMDVYMGEGSVRLSNVLFSNNSASLQFGHGSVTIAKGDTVGGGVTVINSTFGNGSCNPGSGRGCGLALRTMNNAVANVYNSVFGSNVTGDLNFELTAAKHVYRSNVPSILGVTTSLTDVATFDPQLTPTCELPQNSPLINWGMSVAELPFTPLGFDLVGQPRVNGRLDAGAFESPNQFRDGFE